ncbi:acetolactate synthase small subunit [Nitratidesulfovibrio vulgaris]|uniref:acetolactate synthase n=1 Tax=Nitratidesulfovibrio vulgaris (strain DP4) TaxID=391774 RepID=A0A0H3ABC5_NITV4|nr:acetolactate synthase, small subunit [Nitratidesulfovibrio vulgaris DP4]
MRLPTPDDMNGVAPAAGGLIALRLTVNNHPGVMTHICGLFARRAFNVEGILCMPVGVGTSRIWLLVNEDERLEQMIRQVRKLQDVLEVLPFPADMSAFTRLEDSMKVWESGGCRL